MDRALAWLDGSDAPFVAWVHLYDAHKPWPTVDGLRERWLDPAYTGPWRAAPGEVASGHRMPFHDRVDDAALAGRAPEGEDLAAVFAYYDAGLSSVDRELQRLLDGLDARGLSENTLVVVTADHGEELFDTNAYPYHGAGLSRSVLRVPLVFAWAVRDDKRGAGELARGRVVEMPVELADVAPTLLELLDLPRNPGLEAESIVGWLRPEAAPPAAGDRFCELVELDLADTPPRIEGEVFALARERWLRVSNPAGVRVARPPYPGGSGLAHPTALYDLALDPLGGRDVAEEHPELTAELDAALEQRIRRARKGAARGLLPDPALVERLRSLGYVGEER